LRARESLDAASPDTKFVFAEASIDQMSVAQREIVPVRENPELREWKQARKSHLKNPWRQLSLMGHCVLALPPSRYRIGKRELGLASVG
jgi:hypothetical protein